MRDSDKTSTEKATSRKYKVEGLLHQMPSLKGKDVEDLTPRIWMYALQEYRESSGLTWEGLREQKPYEDLRACLIFAKGGYACRYCGPEKSLDKTFNVDHIDPISMKGGEDLTNLQCVCERCNRAKSGMTEEEFLHWMGEIVHHWTEDTA